MNALEKEVLEVLSLVRSVKNAFAPINRIPPEIFSLIPDYCEYDDDDDDDDEDEGDADQDLITLTHVCHGWRDIFISRSSLWTQLDFENVDRTRTYIQRSKSSPLEVYLEKDEDSTYLDDAFLLVTPHIHRIKSITIIADVLPDAIQYFYCHVPLLEELDIHLTCTHAPVLNSALFNGDLSPLRQLRLSGVTTHLPWKNLANLTTFNLKSCHPGHGFVTRLLDFFENAPLLHEIKLDHSIPRSSNAPSGRLISLPHLDLLAIAANPPHSILLNHLSIPTGASLFLRFGFSGDKSPLRDYLPETTANLGNLSHITMLNLNFGPAKKFIRMNGPSGGLVVLAGWRDETVLPYTVDRRILRSLDQSILLTTHRLAVSRYQHPRPAQVEKCPVFQTLSSTRNLRTLILTKCHNLPFILALNPEKNPSRLVLCPNLEELILYIKSQDNFHTKHLVSMAKKRASIDAKLSSITIVGLGELVPGKEVFRLREHVNHVHYRVDDEPPDWNYLPGESSDESE